MRNLALVYHELRSYELAIQQLQQILEVEPAFPRAREILAITYASMGKYEEAFAELGEPGCAAGSGKRRACGENGKVSPCRVLGKAEWQQ
jgi:tetratricopeptide (TPR) repeat protein